MGSRFAVGALAAAALLIASPVLAQEGPSLTIGGTTYTKFLWGTLHDGGAMYNFTTVPGEGFGDNGEGSEVELLINGHLSRQVSVSARLHSRFSQNEWTNFGGFGGRDPALQPEPLEQTPCAGGDCGEFDPRSNQYVKLRGVSVTITPGYLFDSATIGANDFGMFDPFVIGRIRYIDRDNAAGILVQGSAFKRALTWDLTRISLPRLWAGPNFSTGNYTPEDAAYGLQAKYTVSQLLDFGIIGDYVHDVEINAMDNNIDDGRMLRTRYRNIVGGLKVGVHPSSVIDARGAFYYSYSKTNPDLAPFPSGFTSNGGYSPVPFNEKMDWSGKVNIDINDPFENGLSLFVEGFHIGAKYASIMASRRETDVLLTEGHDGAFIFPGPANTSYGLWNTPNIGYIGWSGVAAQVPTINVDNEFTDFDEQAAETVIGWEGVTFAPVWSHGSLDVSGEYSFITYDTNWQAYGDKNMSLLQPDYPVTEEDVGVGHNFRSAYSPFQDKTTHLAALKGKYILDVGKGVEVFGKLKYIYERNNRLNDAKYLPYRAGDCPIPATAAGCSGQRQFYSAVNSTASIYGNPGVFLGPDGQYHYTWDPFDKITDDDRIENYGSAMIGAGYQFTDDLYLSLSYTGYLVDLIDGTTALQAYGNHEMVTGKHQKNIFTLKGKYVLAGVEFGMEAAYGFGWFHPDLAAILGDSSPQAASAAASSSTHVPLGSDGFYTRAGGWSRLDDRFFSQARFKAYMKAQF